MGQMAAFAWLLVWNQVLFSLMLPTRATHSDHLWSNAYKFAHAVVLSTLVSNPRDEQGDWPLRSSQRMEMELLVVAATHHCWRKVSKWFCHMVEWWTKDLRLTKLKDFCLVYSLICKFVTLRCKVAHQKEEGLNRKKWSASTRVIGPWVWHIGHMQ